MGLGVVAIADPPTAIHLKVPFSDGLGGGEVYLGLYDIVFPVVRHNIDMPRFKNKKRARSVDGFRCCSSFSAC